MPKPWRRSWKAPRAFQASFVILSEDSRPPRGGLGPLALRAIFGWGGFARGINLLVVLDRTDVDYGTSRLKMVDTVGLALIITIAAGMLKHNRLGGVARSF